ncbi:MAG TPA: FkbM family methyltransferase [Opitutaceae bacterium]|jgi:FkbM family methyltransferase|nr:FkbM family methyltransferase [Opitutaceae bacterium]
MNSTTASRWRTKLERKIFFDQRRTFAQGCYLSCSALATLGLGGAIDYLCAKLRGAKRATEPASIRVGSGTIIALRDCRTDLAIFEQVILLGDCVPVKAGEHPEYIIDAGAHIGCSSIYYALKYPEARILAVEAAASNFKQLAKNVEKISAIRPLHAAVFYRTGQVMVTNPTDEPWGYQVGSMEQSPPGSGSMIRAMTINELIQLSGFPRVDILKLDIEGAEKEIFETDAKSWLPMVRIMTVELHDRIKPGCSLSFQNAISDLPHELRETLNNVIWINLSAQSADHRP